MYQKNRALMSSTLPKQYENNGVSTKLGKSQSAIFNNNSKLKNQPNFHRILRNSMDITVTKPLMQVTTNIVKNDKFEKRNNHVSLKNSKQYEFAFEYPSANNTNSKQQLKSFRNQLNHNNQQSSLQSNAIDLTNASSKNEWINQYLSNSNYSNQMGRVNKLAQVSIESLNNAIRCNGFEEINHMEPIKEHINHKDKGQAGAGVFHLADILTMHFNDDPNHFANGISDDSCRAALCIDLLLKLSSELPTYSSLLQFIAKEMARYIFEPPSTIQQHLQQSKHNSQFKMKRKNSLFENIGTIQSYQEKQTKKRQWFDNMNNTKLEKLACLPTYRDKLYRIKYGLKEAEKSLKKMSFLNMFNSGVTDNSSKLFAMNVFKEWRKHARNGRLKRNVLLTLRAKNRQDWQSFRSWLKCVRYKKRQSAIFDLDLASTELSRLEDEIVEAKMVKDRYRDNVLKYKTSLCATSDYIRMTSESSCVLCKQKSQKRRKNMISTLRWTLGSYRALEECGLVYDIDDINDSEDIASIDIATDEFVTSK